MEQIRVVFFDAGGTLLRPREAVSEVYVRAGRRYGIEADPDELMRSFLAAFRAKKLDGRPQDRSWWRETVDATFGRFGEATDPDGLFDELYDYFTAPESWCPMDGAHETVEGLRARGYRTGLISNWDDRLPDLLRGLGLASLLDPTVISCQVGVEKPHPRIFRTALEEAGVEPAHALMVGDDHEADVVGARAVGMEALHLHADGRMTSVGARVERLVELLDLLPARAPAS